MAGAAEKLSRKIVGLGAIASISLLAAILAHRWGFLRDIEVRTWDWRLRAVANADTPPSKVFIVMIDQDSLDHFYFNEKIGWPWPREFYAPIIELLRNAGAKGVAFDMLFTEPSKAGHWDDVHLAEAMEGKMPVVAAMILRSTLSGANEADVEDFKEKQRKSAVATGFPGRYLSAATTHRHPYVTLPIKEVLQAAHAVGDVSAQPDEDGVFRQYRPGGFYNDVPVLGLPFALFNAVHGGGEEEYPVEEFLNDEGKLMIRFRGPRDTFPVFSFFEVMASQQAIADGTKPPIDPKVFEDAWVFIGTDAPALLDLKPTPLSQRFPGVEFNATVLDNILTKGFMRQAPFSWNTLIIGFFVTAVSSIGIFAQSLRYQVGGVLALFGIFVTGAFYAAHLGYSILLILPLAAMLVAMIASFVFRYQLEGRQAKFIKDAFQQYVSKAVIENLVQDPSLLSLGGERRELTIFFSDLVSFTSISESIPPSELVPLLGEFFTAMTDIILESGGTLDKYAGDAIIAFWNAPLSVPDHAVKGVRAALDCHRELERMGPELEARYGIRLRMRVGIHTGVVSVGNFGSKARFTYTVIGDAANLASRLEGANKYFKTATLISGKTRDALGGEALCRKIADLRVVGKTEVVPIYEPVRDQPYATSEAIIRWDEARGLFEAGKLVEAKEAFLALVDDPVASVYVARIDREFADVGCPFDPVWKLSEK